MLWVKFSIESEGIFRISCPIFLLCGKKLRTVAERNGTKFSVANRKSEVMPMCKLQACRQP